MNPFDIEIIYGIFNAISDTIIRKQEVSFTSCFLYTLKQSAISGFVEKGLKAGDQTKRLSYSSPADSRYACITIPWLYHKSRFFSIVCFRKIKAGKKQPAYYKLECYMKNSIYKKENPQNSILINCLIQIFSFLILC